jgi:hypothetical protein
MYAKQAHNTEAERRACEVRLRAERKSAQLLRLMKERGELDAGKGGDRKSPSQPTRVKTLADFGITYDQSSKWQKLADIPTDDFEAALRGEEKRSDLAASTQLGTK